MRSLFVLLGLLLTASLSADVYELRRYYAHEGKMPDLLKRFENHTMSLFETHGMKNHGYWMGNDGTLVYLISHKDRAQAKKNWKAFIANPVWKKAHADSRKNGPLVRKIESEFLTATTFSPLK